MQKSHRFGKRSFKVPNRLVLDGALSFSARRMGAVLYGHHNPLGGCRKSLARLAALAGCSISTARTALGELESKEYITRCKHYRYDEKLGRKVYDQYTYHCDLSFDGGYTIIPRDLFCPSLKSSAFVLCLYLYLRAGNGTRAFPSLRRASNELWMAKSTVCRAMKALAANGIILAQYCIKANRAYSSNSYFFLCACPVAAHVAQAAPIRTGRVSCTFPSFPSRYAAAQAAVRRRSSFPLPPKLYGCQDPFSSDFKG